MYWLLLPLIIIAIVLFITLVAIARGKYLDNSQKHINKKFLIVIAHPDDEAMFMQPTVK